MAEKLSTEENSTNQTEENFFPKGSIVFFLIMIVFFIAVWFAFYALAIARG